MTNSIGVFGEIITGWVLYQMNAPTWLWVIFVLKICIDVICFVADKIVNTKSR